MIPGAGNERAEIDAEPLSAPPGDDDMPPDAAARVASLLAANRARRRGDPEGMGGDTWVSVL
jgi:hypothetical protein